MTVSRGLAEITAGTGVTVNSVLPGPTASSGVKEFVHQVAQSRGIPPQQVEEEFFNTLRPGSLHRRFATPDEIGVVIAFVCSPRAAAINGAALRAEGGLIRSVI